MKRFLSLLVVLAMVIGMVPFGVFAAEGATEITDISKPLEIDLTNEEVFYSWTPEEDGSLTVSVSSEDSGYAWWIVVNDNEYEPDDYTESYTIESVEAGVPVVIGMVADGDAKVSLDLIFTSLPGTEGNPIYLNGEDTDITLEANVPAYYKGRFADVTMYVEPAAGVTVRVGEDTYTADAEGVLAVKFPATAPGVRPEEITISITAVTAGDYAVKFVSPEGSEKNPAEVEMTMAADGNGSYSGSATVAKGTNGYYYNWTAEAAGAMTITMPETGDWSYRVTNKASTVSAEDDTAVETDEEGAAVPINYSATIAVQKGDVIEILVNTFDPADPIIAPAGTVNFALSFVKSTEEEGGDSGDSGEVSGETVTLTSGDDVYVYAYTATKDGVLTLKINAATPGYKYEFGPGTGEEFTESYVNGTGANPESIELTVKGGKTYLLKLYGYSRTEWGTTAGTITYELSFTEGSGEVVLADYEISNTALTVGENTLTLLDTAVVTCFEFAPTETGIYTITAPYGVYINNWGTSFLPGDKTEEETSSLTFDCYSLGQSMLIGVSDVEDSFTLTIQRTGDTGHVDINYETYENKHTPAVFKCFEITGSYVNVQNSTIDTAVLGEDGYYHLNSADGDILFVHFAANTISLSAMLGTGSARYVTYDAEGKVQEAIDYTAAMTAYSEKTTGGYYPLTADLMEMLQNVGETKGWFVEDAYAQSTAEDAWMFLCQTGKLSHTAGTSETVGEEVITYCSVCNAEMSRVPVSGGEDGGDEDPVDPTAGAFTINGTSYLADEFATKIAAAPADAEVVLLQDIDLGTSTLTISKNMTLDLNGKTLTSKVSGAVVNVTAGTLTIQDTSAEGDGLIQNTATTSTRGVLNSGANAKLILKSGSITATTQGVRVEAGEFVCEGGNIIATASSSAYAIYANGTSVVTINGGTITANSGTQWCYGLYCMGQTTVTVTGGTMEGSTFSMYCGGTVTPSVEGGYFKGSINGATALVGKVTGGYYANTVAANYIASGYEVVDNSANDSTYIYAVVDPNAPVVPENPEPGEARETAIELTLGQSWSLPLTPDACDYWYKYTATEDITVSMAMSEVVAESGSVLFIDGYYNDSTDYDFYNDFNGIATAELVTGDVVYFRVYFAEPDNGSATLTFSEVVPEEPFDGILELGDNAIPAAASTTVTGTWTATANGTLTVSVVGLILDGQEVPGAQIGMPIGMGNPAVLVNGVQLSETTTTVEVAKGDVVTVQIQPRATAKVTLNLALEESGEAEGVLASGTETFADDAAAFAGKVYNIAVTEAGTLTVDFTAVDPGYYVSIFDVDAEEMVEEAYGGSAAAFTAELAAGNYEVLVSSATYYSENFAYTSAGTITYTISFDGEATVADDGNEGGEDETNVLILGENEINVGADGVTAVYTADEAGILTVTVTALSAYDSENDTWTELNPEQQFGGMYGMEVNGSDNYTNTQTVDVEAGGTVSVRLYHWFGTSFKATVLIEKSEGGEVTEPDGSVNAPYVIYSLPYTVTGNLSYDGVFYKYVAEKAGTINTSVENENCLVSAQLNGEPTSFPVEVGFGDVLIINPWAAEDTSAFSVKIAYELGEPDGSYDNPYIIEEIPYDIVREDTTDVYYAWTVDEDCKIEVSYPEDGEPAISVVGRYAETEGNAANRTVTIDVAKGETLIVNVWSAGTFTVKKVTPAAMIGDAKYYDVEEALEAAGEMATAEAPVTVELTADAEVGYAIITPNVTLDLGSYTLKADYVIGLEGSHLTGTCYVKGGEYGQLVVDQNKIALDSAAPIDDAGYTLMPVRVGNAYVISRMITRITAYEGKGFEINEAADSIEVVFQLNATKNIRELFVAEGTVAHGVSLILSAEWANQNAKLSQEFEFINAYTGVPFTDENLGATLNGYSALQDLSIKLKVVSETGVEVTYTYQLPEAEIAE